MKPYAFLRRFSASTAVAPLPIPTPFDQQLKPLLHALLLPTRDQCPATSSAWFLDALQASIKTQTIAFDSLKNMDFRQSDRAAIESYLEDNVEVLDACNLLSEKMEIIQEYIKSLRAVTHLLHNNSNPHPTILARALSLLESSSIAINRRFTETLNTNKSRSSLKRSSSSKKLLVDCSEYGEILTSSLDIASTVYRMLEISLQLKPNRLTWSISLHKQFQGKKYGGSNSSSMMLMELQQTVKVGRDLQNHIRFGLKSEVGDQLKLVVGELESKCDHLEENVVGLDMRVSDLYKHLVSIRMSLLGTLSRA